MRQGPGTPMTNDQCAKECATFPYFGLTGKEGNCVCDFDLAAATEKGSKECGTNGGNKCVAIKKQILKDEGGYLTIKPLGTFVEKSSNSSWVHKPED